MSRCDSPRPTPVSGLNRRGLLVGAGAAVTAAATIPALAASQGFSPEFLRWYAIAKTLPAVLDADTVWERAHPNASDEALNSSPYGQHNAALHEIEQVIFDRPVRSWQDVAELGMIALYWTDKKWALEDGDHVAPFALGRDPDLETEYWGERPSAYLIQAAAKLAMGGGAHG